ncbi:MAG: ATPase [Bacteroidales bacterium]|nr:ATPase [Bacteroidales bacterium]MDZ4203660.1 ATPase [Bacteroidales bacterium]
MIIVADSGSTKTDWRIYDKKHGIRQLQTIGMNPYFLNSDKVTEVLEKDLLPYLNPKNVGEVYFYGSGCTLSEKVREIEYPLSDLFTEATIAVESDLLGTARALCGNSAGLIGILGTGSNSCIYDGRYITKQINSLGYVLGDEGSGAILGRSLVKAFFENKLPVDLEKDFFEKHPVSLSRTLDMIYRQSFPNMFLASFAPFAFQHKTNPWMKELLNSHFEAFFTHMVTVYEDYRQFTLHLSGSIAHYFGEFVEEAAKNHRIALGRIIIQPVDDILNYHIQQHSE